MKALKWKIGDIIDLEYFFKKDISKTDQTYLKQRDRTIYLHSIEPVLNKEESLDEIYHKKDFNPGKVKKNMIRLWLDEIKAKKNAEASSSLMFPGDLYEEIHRILKIFFLVFGILIGISLCGSLFSYTGTNPLNIAYFLVITLVPQILLLTILCLSFFMTKLRLIKKRLPIPYRLVSFCIEKLIIWSDKRVFRKMSGLNREKILSALGIMREGHIVYGFLFFWPVFILLQLFAMGFNIGVLGSTLFHILFFDTAFGWQSTVQVNSNLVHEIVSIIATPWSWFTPHNIAMPNLAEIQGSRMILKNGIFHLTTVNLVSWWPFLCFSVFFYGFLPRFILFISANICLKRNLDHQKLNHGDCSRLLRRMLLPVVSINSINRGEKSSTNSIRPPFSPDPKIPTDTDKCSESIRGYLESVKEMAKEFTALIPDDIYDQCDFDQLKQIVKNNLGCYLKNKKRIGTDLNKDMEMIIRTISENDEGSFNGFILLYEAWQPPIRELLKFVKNIRETGEQEMPFIIVLIGKPYKETIFTPVREMDLKIWNIKITGLGDPYIQVEALM